MPRMVDCGDRCTRGDHGPIGVIEGLHACNPGPFYATVRWDDGRVESVLRSELVPIGLTPDEERDLVAITAEEHGVRQLSGNASRTRIGQVYFNRGEPA